jgi:hypothetical protein
MFICGREGSEWQSSHEIDLTAHNSAVPTMAAFPGKNISTPLCPSLILNNFHCKSQQDFCGCQRHKL